VVRTGEPAGHRGYFHEALLYNSEEEFLAAALPFLQDGVAAGEPESRSWWRWARGLPHWCRPRSATPPEWTCTCS
jgi:hypothetical protein